MHNLGEDFLGGRERHCLEGLHVVTLQHPVFVIQDFHHELGGHYRVFLLWSEELVELHLVVELLLIRDEVTCLGLLDHWFDSFLTDSSLHCV